MKHIATMNGYDFWLGTTGGKNFYNVTPVGQATPTGGYYDADYICGVKNVPNCFC